MSASEQKETVVVAMSGGVDSACAAALLADEGRKVVGISMQVWDYRRHGGNAKRATCCAPADFEDARKVSEALGFPYYVFDFEESFEEQVIRPFVNSYLNGRTPNPCVECNRKVKFRELRKRAQSLGAEKIATGHYAQIKRHDDGTLGLFTSCDTLKDQSYFLYAITQDELAHTLFPVGGMTKREVREFLHSRGFQISAKAESQDICFVSSSVAEFVERHSEGKTTAGNILSTDGKVLGKHGGIHNFTVGQRQGLGVSNANPLYVLEIASENHTVVVGEKDQLERESFTIDDVNWIRGSAPADSSRFLAKLRYRHKGVRCEVTRSSETSYTARFLEEWSAVSPGQAAVFYSERPECEGSVEVIGGGTIQ